MKQDLLKRYSRQIILKNIGALGQKKLIKSKILIIGAGGLGCTIVDHLVRAGIGTIGVIDDDKIDISNLHRQSLFSTRDLKKYKVDVLKKKSKEINPNIKIKILKKKINRNNIKSIIKNYEILIDGSDNFKTKFLLNEYSILFKKKLIIGAISKFEGHIFSFDFNKRNCPCLKCFYQIIPSDGVLDCENDGVIGPIAGLIGSIQANEAIKTILKIGNNLIGKILIMDLLSLNFRLAKYSKKKSCVC